MDLNTLLAQKIETFQHGYYLWIGIYGLLGLGSIIFPAVAAFPIFNEVRSRIAAGIGALCATIFAFLQPNTYATAFDMALKMARDAQISYSAGKSTPEQIVAQLINAEDITHFSYSGLQDKAQPK
jgi:hypothetical protein